MSRVSSERGFALTATLVLVPLLMSVAGAVAAALIAMRAQEQALHGCRTALLFAQAELAHGLKRLMAMNPEATRLRRKMARAKAMAIATAGTPAGAKWAAEVARLLALQIALDGRQRAVMLSANALASTAHAKGKVEIARAYSSLAVRFSGRAPDATRGSAAAGLPPTMQLTRVPLIGFAPSYMPAKNAQILQTSRLAWSVRLASLAPRWIPLSKDSENALSSAQCASTVETKEKKWLPLLAADKR